MGALSILAIIWCSVYVAVILSKQTRLTPVLYFLFLGAVMVNIGILPKETDPFIRGFADIGIIIIMFALGFEENPRHFMQSIKRSWGIAFFGGVVPFLGAYLVADYFFHDSNIAIISGLAMTSTAVSLTMVSLKSEKLHHMAAAKGILTSAILEDIASLAMVAILIPIATGEAPASIPGVALILFKAMIFFLIIAALGLFLFPNEATPIINRVRFLGTIGIKQFLAFGEGQHATLTVLLIALLVGLLAYHFGFHPAVGAYMAGLILKEEYFHFHDHPNTNYYENTKKIVDNVAFSWIGPVFFVTLGTQIVFDWQVMLSVIPESMVMILAMVIAQISSSALAARYTGHFNWPQSVLIGVGMLGRAELMFVVLDIAYVQHAILSERAFYMLMITAFWLNVMVPISIALWKRWFPGEITSY